MRNAAIKTMLLATVAGCSAWAQNSDFGILFGVSPNNGMSPNDSAAFGGSQFTYARQVLDTRTGGLYLEFPFLSITNGFRNTNIFFTPGVRFKLSTASRFSVYGAVGAGVASFGGTDVAGRTTSGAFEFGGGMDVRLTKLLSLRTEVRDFVTRPRLGYYTGRNHPIFGLGIAFHF